MERIMWKKVKLVGVVLCMLWIVSGCIEREPIENGGTNGGTPLGAKSSVTARDLRAFFPAAEGLTYQFVGEGNEYASFTRSIKYLRKPYVQFYDDNGGTVSVSVYELQKDQIVRVFFQGEFYEEKNILDQIGKGKVHEEVILKSPLKAGTYWESAEWRKEIVDANLTITVPAGTFYEVVKVKITSRNKENTAVSYEYYAVNMGLILREYKDDGFEVTSRLASYAKANAGADARETSGSPAITSADGPDVKTVALMQNPNLPLLAYQLEHQLRAAFRSAYESYVNLKQFASPDQKQFEQILAVFREDVRGLAADELVREQVELLQEYYDANQEEVSFPNYEVVQAAKLLSRTSETARVGLTVQKHYPEKDWSGRAVDRRGDYIVELAKTDLSWKITSVEEAD